MIDPIIKVEDSEFEILISPDILYKRVRELAEQISNDYQGKIPIFIGVLNGAVLFLADIIRAINIDCEIDFIKISSYGNQRISSGAITMIKDFSANLFDRDVIVVEDIVDSGLSINYLKQRIEKMKPASIKFVSLLVKTGCAQVAYNIDYVGFEVEDKYVIGYGLDIAQKKRNLNGIYQIRQ